MKLTDMKTTLTGPTESVRALNELLASFELQGVQDTDGIYDLLYDYERQAKELKKLQIYQPRKAVIRDGIPTCPNCKRKIIWSDFECPYCKQKIRM